MFYTQGVEILGAVQEVAPLYTLYFILYTQGVEILGAVQEVAPPGDFQWDGSWFGHPGSELVDFYAGTPRLREQLAARYDV